MATYRCWSGSGVTQRANSTAYSLGARMQPSTSDTSTNHAVAKRYVWECTTAGTSAGAVPSWSASYTVDSSTITDGTVTWTCRAPGLSSGSTVDWTFASLYVFYTHTLCAAGDIILVHYTSQEPTNSATMAITFAVDNVQIISVDKDSSEAYTPMGTSGYICNTSANATNSINAWAVKLRLRGITLRNTGTSGSVLLLLNGNDDGHIVGEDIRLEYTGNNNVQMCIGSTGDARTWTSIRNLTVSNANAGQLLRLGSFGEIMGLTFTGTVARTILFQLTNTVDATGTRWLIHSMDASHTTSVSSSATLVADNTAIGGRIEFLDPILPSSYAILSGASNVNQAGLEVLIQNGKAGSTTGIHAYSNALGSVTRNTTITYNGEAFSWKIDAAAGATRAAPFVMPWMWGQIATGASVTPKIEILRDGSTTALTDAEVWCERGAQVTSGSPLKTFVSTEAAYTSSGSNIATGAGTGSWAGEAGSAWSGKLAQAACTPEGDELMMRVCVATTTSVYVAQGWDT